MKRLKFVSQSMLLITHSASICNTRQHRGHAPRTITSGFTGPVQTSQHRSPPEKGLRVQPFVITRLGHRVSASIVASGDRLNQVFAFHFSGDKYSASFAFSHRSVTIITVPVSMHALHAVMKAAISHSENSSPLKSVSRSFSSCASISCNSVG